MAWISKALPQRLRRANNEKPKVVFSVEFLHVIRQYELEAVAELLPPGASVLELGAGTGYQARELEQRGFKMIAIDLASSNYGQERVFPVIDYDGCVFPVPDKSVNVVFSSNVLEHIRDLAQIQREIHRVLKPDGYCVHVMPTSAWRLWTTLSGWVDVLPAVRPILPDISPLPFNRYTPRRMVGAAWHLARTIGGHILPVRHGETGNAFTELWTFSRHHWVRHFKACGFEVVVARPMGLFYTGYMVFGPRCAIEKRERLSHWLGSACMIYEVRPSLARA